MFTIWYHPSWCISFFVLFLWQIQYYIDYGKTFCIWYVGG